MTSAVRLAHARELEALPALEAAADTLFTSSGLAWVPPVATRVADLAGAAAVLVAGEPACGFARLEIVEGQGADESRWRPGRPVTGARRPVAAIDGGPRPATTTPRWSATGSDGMGPP